MRTSLSHWLQLLSAFPGVADAEKWHARLVAAYSEPHRAYHNLTHLEECLLACDEARGRKLLNSPDELEMAFWFHDAVYKPRQHDNEELSAKLAMEMLGDNEVARRVVALIMLTHRHQPGRGPDDGWMIDIDLSIFAKPLPRLLEYERQIREEYSWVEEEEYRTKRCEILRAFQLRPQLYLTQYYHDHYERAAKHGLQTLIEYCPEYRKAK